MNYILKVLGSPCKIVRIFPVSCNGRKPETSLAIPNDGFEIPENQVCQPTSKFVQRPFYDGKVLPTLLSERPARRKPSSVDDPGMLASSYISAVRAGCLIDNDWQCDLLAVEPDSTCRD